MYPNLKKILSVGACLLATGLMVPSAPASVIYTQTISESLATVSTLNDLSNCRDNEGCLGKTGHVYDAAGNALAIGNLTDTILYTFTLTPAEINAISANAGTATLSVTAARDLGLKAGELTNTDFLDTTLDGTLIGNLFGTTVSTCPAGLNINPINFVCGPNYYNDVTAVSSLTVSDSLFQAAATDGTLNVLLNPTDDVDRLKIFSLTLQFESDSRSVPEPGTLAILALSLAGLGISRWQRVR